jgi:hypothetical protein
MDSSGTGTPWPSWRRSPAQAAQAIARVDDLLNAFTEPDQRHLVHRFTAEEAGRQ